VEASVKPHPRWPGCRSKPSIGTTRTRTICQRSHAGGLRQASVTAMSRMSHRDVVRPIRRRAFHRPGGIIFATSCLRISWRSTASSPRCAPFPELGWRYQEATTAPAMPSSPAYLDLWADAEGWIVRDKQTAAQVFAGLLKAGIFDEALLGLSQPSNDEIVEQRRLPRRICFCFSARAFLADRYVRD